MTSRIKHAIGAVGLAPLILASCDSLVSPDLTAPRNAVTASGEAPTFAVDVSFWAGFLAESEVACWYDSGVRHAVIGTQSATYTKQQLGLAVDAGLSVDAYVYLYWHVNMTAQVQTALNTVADFPIQRLWLDAEAPPDGRTASQLVGKLQEAAAACGDQPCGIYTRKVWWRDNMADSRAFAHLPIWYAYYNGQDDFDDWYSPAYWYEGPFGGWSDPTGKQYHSDWTAPDLCGVNVDYNAMYTLAPPDDPPFQAEMGKVTINQANQDTWAEVTLDNTYVNPVVIMQPPSYAGGHPSTIRLRNVTANSFEFQIDEWDYLDGAHTTESMGYLVVEAGVHQLEGGGRVQAGTVSADHQFTTVTFRDAFGNTPVVLSQVQTANENAAVVTRQRDASAGQFDVRLQEEEGGDGVHAAETVGYLAVEPGTGVMAGNPFEAARTPDVVTHDWHALRFAQRYADAVLLAGMQTFDGSDPAALRYRSLSTTGGDIKVEEEASGDAEVAHTTEVVGYLVFENPDPSGGVTDPPGAPTGLSPDNGLTFPSGSAVTMSSNPIADAVEYEFDIEWLDGNAWAHYYTYLAATSSRTFSPAIDNTPYRWRVRARNTVGWGAWSAWATFDFGTVPRVPPAPTGLSPDNGQSFPSGSSVTLSSAPITGANSYEFEIDYSSGGTWRDYYTYAGTTPSRTFWPVYNNTSYRWRIRARNASGWGAWSAWATFDMGTVATVPAVPSGLTPSNGQTITTSSVTMSANTVSGATAYEFRIEHLSGTEWRTYYTYSTSTNSQTFWPVYDNRSYRFAVRAQNATGWSAWSGWAIFYFSP